MSKWSRRQRWAMKVAATVALLATVALWADVSSVLGVLKHLDIGWLALAAALFVPQTLVSALRWRYLCSEQVKLTAREALRQTLAVSASNLVVPGKLGDVAKAGMLGRLADRPLTNRVALVVIERGNDVAALAALWLSGAVALRSGVTGVLAAAFVAAIMAGAVIAIWRRTPLAVIASAGRMAGTGVVSLLLWGLHLAQIQTMILAAGVDASWLVAMARVPAAIFAGLLPISLWGVGTRDATLIALYADTAAASTMAAVGLLTASRYLVPGLVGVPFLVGYLSGDKSPDDKCATADALVASSVDLRRAASLVSTSTSGSR